MTVSISVDEEGSEFPNVAAARSEAVECVRELLVEAIRSSKDTTPDCVVVADADGRELAMVPIKEALPLHLR